MSSQISAGRRIRVAVESVDVEIDDDDGIQWTSLQTAFPGCSGLFFRDRDADSKCSVKFDGKKFQPPGGNWNDRAYFVALGQRCHSQMASGAYESATKTFERNVNIVQKMLSSTMGADSSRLRRLKPSSTSSPPPTEDHSVSSATSDMAASMQERSELLRSAGRPLIPIEQQFLELAKISTGKDSIIDHQREELRKLQDQIKESEKQLKESSERASDLRRKVDAQEEELKMFRKLGAEQVNMQDTVRQLSSSLAEKEKELHQLKELMESQQIEWRTVENNNRESISSLSLQLKTESEKLSEVKEQLEVALVSRGLLADEVSQLKPLADLIDLENPRDVLSYSKAIETARGLEESNGKIKGEMDEVRDSHQNLTQLHDTMMRENTRLTQRNEELESRISNVDRELKSLNEQWKEKLDERQADWTIQIDEAHQEVLSLKDQASSLQNMLAKATKEATENAARLEEAETKRQRLKEEMHSVEFRNQEPLLRQIANLTEDLEEAERRVGELTSLVASLTVDAQNSRRDIDDLSTELF